MTRKSPLATAHAVNRATALLGRGCIYAAQAAVFGSALMLTGTAVLASIDQGRQPTRQPIADAVAGYLQQRGHVIHNRNGRFLTPASRRPAADIALDYIRRNAAAFAMAPHEVDTLYVARTYTAPHSGAHYVTFGQRIDGIRVHGATISATLDRNGRIALVGGRAGSTRAAGTPLLTAADAIARSAQFGGSARQALPSQADTRGPGPHRYPNVYARGLPDAHPLTAELVWFIQADRSLRLAWLTDVELSGQSWHETLVDAGSGAVIARESRYDHASGRVFTGQHPDADPDRELVDFTPWINVVPGATVTSGNNVNAYQDLSNDNAVGYRPTSPDDDAFDFAFTDAWRGLPDATDFVDIPEATWTAALNADRDAVITQLFHYTNDIHDWLYGYGFDEPSGNFQIDNFGLGGLGNDPVLAEAHDGIDFGCSSGTARCANNANFGTPADGGSPRMQMYLWIRPDRPYRDGSLDGDVIAHEYGHGVSNRLVPGALSGGINQAGSLGEGWSDVISYLKWDDAVVGEYVTGNAGTGIRSVADLIKAAQAAGKAVRVVSLPVGHHQMTETPDATLFAIRDFLQGR